MSRPPLSADEDSLFTRVVRAARHPLRALSMSVAAFCFAADVAMTGGLVASVLGCLVGVALGEWLGRSRIRLSALGLGFGAVGVLAATTAWLLGHVELVVSLLGTGWALSLASFVGYGGLSLAGFGAMRALGKRRPSWVVLEVGVLVLSVASALAAHRGGVVARPLWLSDLAWRQGIDPADVFVGIGLGAAMVAISLMLFERKGRLGLAALPLIPLLALLAVSCFQFTREATDPGEASPDPSEETAQPGDEQDDHGPPGGHDGGADDDDGPLDGGASAGDGGLDGGASAGDGGRDGGASGGGGDGGLDGGASGGGGDGGLDGGASGGGDGGRDGGASGGGDGGRDGGASGGGDGGRDGGSGGGARPDGGGSTPPPDTRDDASREGGAVTPQDLRDQPPQRGSGAGAPVAVVLFEADYSPPSEGYYFRQDAWSQLEGRRLVPATRPGVDPDLLRRFPTGRTEVTPQPGSFGRTGVVTTVALTVAHPAPFGLESPAWFAEARNPNTSRFRRAYRVLSQAQSGDYSTLLGRAAGAAEWSPEVRATYLETHPDPRFQAFADETVATLREPQRADPFARAIALKLRLDSMLTYSTAERHADAEDPAVDFFFGNRIGYCVHFAHTAVYLFRAAGIPSRIGVGYMSAESNRRGGSALVLQAGDAHAWPEVYVEGAGWIVLDIAAARNLDPPRPPQDEDAQQMLGEMAREEPPDPEDEATPPEDAPPRTPLARSLAVAFLLALLAALAGLYAIKAWRRLAPFLVGETARPRVSYRATLDRLAEVGMIRAYGETREQFAARAAALSPSFAGATERMLAVSLGPPGVRGDAHDAAAWAANTAAVRREVNAATPPLRRWLGRVHPLSFLDSR